LLDDGVMVGPGLLETVCEQFDGGRALAVPYQKASCCGAESAYHPKNIFHCVAPSWRPDCDLSGIAICLLVVRMRLGGWMRQCSGALLVGVELSGCGGNGYTLGYGFGSIRSCAGNWSAFGREDDGVGGGCGDSSESFRGGEGERECCGFGFNSCFGVYCFGFDGGFG
jgi:hypothetical protein